MVTAGASRIRDEFLRRSVGTGLEQFVSRLMVSSAPQLIETFRGSSRSTLSAKAAKDATSSCRGVSKTWGNLLASPGLTSLADA